MNIIDIMIARALTPQAQVETYAQKANKAAVDASNAASSAEQAVSNSQTALVDAQNAAAQYEDLINAASSVIDEHVHQILDDEYIPDIEQDLQTLENIIPEISILNTNNATANTAKLTSIVNNIESSINIKNYKSTGNNEDGSMTQKAITEALNNIANNITPGTPIDITTNLGQENAGKIVVVGPNGNITAGVTSEESIIETLIKSDSYVAKHAVGIEVNYTDKICNRTQEAVMLNQGTDFDAFLMYGGRKRCTVADNGSIIAFYGDNNYIEDGSNGQVMVYQPKFYYQRIPLASTTTNNNRNIKRESIILSDTPQAGFKLHPLFIAANGDELEYVLLSAYEGCLYRAAINNYDYADGENFNSSADKLSSIINAKPVSGAKKEFTVMTAEQTANNRGNGWHITNLLAESASQLLQMVEYGSLNSQTALEAGVTTINSASNYNCASLTGSTSSLGNVSGAANATINESNGSNTTYTTAGKRAISYRGMENPWGNIWRFVGGVRVVGTGDTNGGNLLINNTYDYSDIYSYQDTEITIPNGNGYINGFAYAPQYDWAFIPVNITGGNSALPVGDEIYTTINLNGTNAMLCGGRWSKGTSSGMFAYGCDQNIESYTGIASARLMFIPTVNSIYENNITKWRATFNN